MPTKRRLPKAINLNPIETVQPDPSPVKRYLFLVVLVMMALCAAYLLIIGVGNKPPETVPQEVAEAPSVPQVPATDPVSIADRAKAHLYMNSTEQPRIWQISNIDLVKPQNQVLFKDASEGDYVLMWSDRVAVYSPNKDRIVGMLMAATSGTGQTVPTATSTEPTATNSLPTAGSATPARIEIRNASGVAGEARRMKTDLGSIGLKVFKIGDSTIKRTGITIVDLSNGTQSQTVSTIQGSTSGTVVTSLPDGEPTTNAEILVLIGK